MKIVNRLMNFNIFRTTTWIQSYNNDVTIQKQNESG